MQLLQKIYTYPVAAKNSTDWFRFWAWFFLTVVVLNIVIHIIFEDGDFEEVVWFCNVSAFCLTYGLLVRKTPLINAILAIAIPTQFFWIGDFILELFGKGMGRTDWLFETSTLSLTVVLSVLLHGFTIPVSLWATLKLGFSEKAYAWMQPFCFIMLPVSYYFTNPIGNRNCVFYPCDLSYGRDYFTIIHGNYMTLHYFINIMFMWIGICTLSFLILSFLFYQWRKWDPKSAPPVAVE